MPELPEVETIVRDLRPRVTGAAIRGATLSHTDVLRGVTRPALLRALAGATIGAVTRRAKHAVFDLGDRRLVVQPGMSGALLVHEAPLTPTEARYAVLVCDLADGRRLVYRDVRRLGTLRLLDARGWARHDAALGVEPLDPAFTPAALADRLRGSRQAVKKVLMDQRRIAGVGNIYANEALFEAGIDPSRAAGTLGAAEVAALHAALVDVLRRAVAARGTTVRDYRTGTGQRGGFQPALRAYGREGEPCVRCGTRLAGTHAIDARITVFCHRCQR